MSDRKGFVDINGSASSCFFLPAGVSQGSLLSPHLFNIFNNDITLPDDCEIAIHADDTALFCDVPLKDHAQVKDKLISAVDLVTRFFDKWKIKLNSNKTELTVFTRSSVMRKELCRKNPPILNGKTLTWRPCVKYLGIDLDRRLSFKDHIARVVKKAKIVQK